MTASSHAGVCWLRIRVPLCLQYSPGGRADWSELTEWDRQCGFRPGQDVAAVRRSEDLAATSRLRAIPCWLDLPEYAYRSEALAIPQVVNLIVDLLDRLDPSLLLIPLGLRHPDHLSAANIAMKVVQRIEGMSWMAYADFYHIANPELVTARLAELDAGGIAFRPTQLELGSVRSKRRAIRCYSSQVRGLGGRTGRWAARAPEALWEPG